MKKIALLFLLATIVMLPIKSWATDSVEDRVQKLEQDIEELRTLKAGKDKEAIKSKFPIDLYGFIAAQLFWGGAQTQLYTTGTGSIVAQSMVSDRTLVPNDDAWFGATPQNTRLGLNWTGSKVSEKLTLGGKLEIDFLNPGGGASPRPRIRLCYLDLSGENWMLRAGQDWDVFSPLNTRSLSLAGNLWFQGNLGFRRPQLRFTYQVPFADVNAFIFTAAVNNPSNLDTTITNGNTSSVPYGEASIQYTRKMKAGTLVAAASGIYGTQRNTGTWDKVWGIAGSLSVPFHKFLQLDGEFQYGKNLGDFLTYAGTTREIRSISAWAEISSRWHEMLETNAGYGIDNLQTSKVTFHNTSAALMTNGINRNQVIFANFKFFPVKPFYIGVEYNNMRTQYRGSGTSTANIVFSNLVFTF